MDKKKELRQWGFAGLLAGGLLMATSIFVGDGGGNVWGLLTGGVVLVMAGLVRTRPQKARAWGGFAILAAVIGLMGASGFLGPATAIAGGALAAAAGDEGRTDAPT